MRAVWWWIDRWRQSTAYTDMTAEEQGLYRNLMDEVWNRADNVIPDDPRILSRVSGDPEAWARCGERVLGWMKKVPGGWTNTTALEVIGQSRRRAEKQKRYRDSIGNGTGNGRSNRGGNTGGSPSPSPSPSPDMSPTPETDTTDPPPPPQGGQSEGAVLTPPDTPRRKPRARKPSSPVLEPEVVTGAWPGEWSRRVVDILQEFGDAPPSPFLKALKPLEKRWPFDQVETGLRAYAEAGKLTFGAQPFVRDVKQWVDGISRGSAREKRNDEVLRRFMEDAT